MKSPIPFDFRIHALKNWLQGILGLLAAAFSFAVAGSSIIPLSLDEEVRTSDAIFRGTVLRNVSFQGTDGIYTRTIFRVDESLKGRFPHIVQLVHRGGTLETIGQSDSLSPQFKIGEERLVFVARRGDGTLFALQGESSAPRLLRARGAFLQAHERLLDGVRARTNFDKAPGADVTGQAANDFPSGSIGAPSGDNGGASTNGLLVDANNVPARFSTPDRGETIPYLVDTNSLPTGITPSQALTAVSNAVSAWASGSSYKFVFAGTQNFGQASPTITNFDGTFRIQLHDDTNYIIATNVLGIGGSYFTVGLLTNANWGPGGNVAGTEFNKSLCGFVILKHTNSALQNIQTFTEVLTHEVGHVLGLAHSSNIVTNDPVLTNSIMYFLAHEDGRGAKLNSYDTNVVREVNPLNTPPYAYDRVLDATTSPFGAPNVAGINQIEVRGYDLQSTSLTLATNNASKVGNGSFSLAGNLLKFTQAGYIGGSRLDPAGSSFKEIIYARFSDGTNASPYVKNRVISMNPDSDSPSSDGVPDAWMTSYFGHTDPQSGDKSRASDDADADGLSNLGEYIAGMVPTNSSSAQRITFINTSTLQWQAKAYEMYEIQSSTNLSTWTRFGNPVLPTTATGSISNFYNPASPGQFFRILKVP